MHPRSNNAHFHFTTHKIITATSHDFFVFFFLRLANQGESPMPEATQPPENEEDSTTVAPTVEIIPETGSDDGNEKTGK